MNKVTIEAMIPDGHLEAFLISLRKFDQSHADCHFRVLAIDGGLHADEVGEMLERIGFETVIVIKK